MEGGLMAEAARALALVLALLGALHLGARRLAGKRGGVRRGLRVMETSALGARKRLHVVEVDGCRLLIAASETGVSLLRSLPPAAAEPMPLEAAEDSPAEPMPLEAAEDSPAGAAARPTEADAPVETAQPAAPRAPDAAPGTVGRRRWRVFHAAAIAGIGLWLAAGAALAPEAAAQADGASGITLSLNGVEQGEGLSPAIEMLLLLTVLSAAPSILLMATCFTRVVIVLAFVRQAIGVQHLPPNQVLVGLALFVTLFVMAPLGERIRVEAYEPYKAQEISADEAGTRALVPVRLFMMEHTREADLALFVEMAGDEPPAELEEIPISTLVPAFLISELRTAFEIGFVVFLPFLVIDLVVSSMLISMGMIVLPPMVVALPFKIMLFVLVDGWQLVLGSLVDGLR